MEIFNLDTWLKDKSRKVVTRKGRPVRIVCWDSPNKGFPIVGFIDDNPTVFVWYKYGYDALSGHRESNLDLFFVDEEEDLTELQKTLEEDCDYYVKLYNDGNTREELREWIKCWCHRIIDLARNEIEKLNPYSGNQKQEWSEEDEKLYTSALWHIKNSCGNGGKDSGEYEVYNWLKSIKDRVHPQPKLEWSKEEEERLITDYLKFKGYEDDSIWFKSFKDRVQPKQEWSEKDEHCIELLLPIIDSSSLIPKNRKKCKEFLKSLKDRVQPQPEQKWNKEDEFMLTRCIGILGKCYMGELPTKVEEELVWLISVKELMQI